MGYRPDVGALLSHPGGGLAPDPVVVTAEGVFATDQRIAVDALAKPRHLDPLDLGTWRRGDVDVEQDRAAHTVAGHHALRQPRGKLGGVGEVPLVVVGQRDGDGRHAPDHALHRGGDGAGVGDVIGEVGPLVDAGDH